MRFWRHTAITALLLTVPCGVAWAAQNSGVNYTPIVGLPFMNSQQGGINLEEFVRIIYATAIAIAALLAVIKIIHAGVKYMLTDVVTSKGDAKQDIQGALLGLIIVLSAVFILEQINPQLTNIRLLDGAPGGFSRSQVNPTPAPAVQSVNPNSSATDGSTDDGAADASLFIPR